MNANLVAVPEFLAGLMYGFTSENHLTEIEACYQGGTFLLSEIEIGIKDIQVGGWDEDLQAALEFGLVALQIPQALKTCESMGDDLQAIEQWAAAFKDPVQLMETLTKNYMLHKKAVTADLDATKAEWGAQEYFQAGKSVADLLVVLVGPVVVPTPTNLSSNLKMPVSGALEFLGGFMFGFVGDNHLTEIQTCAKDADSLATESIQVVEDFLGGKTTDALAELATIYSQLATDLADCKGMSTDIAAIKQWATMFTDKTALMATVTANFLKHHKAITADMSAEKTEFAAGQYYQAGLTAADLATLALGPIEPAKMAMSKLNMDLMAIPDFIAGFVFGMTGDNNLTEFEACA